jgi:hypothetical protein
LIISDPVYKNKPLQTFECLTDVKSRVETSVQTEVTDDMLLEERYTAKRKKSGITHETPMQYQSFDQLFTLISPTY